MDNIWAFDETLEDCIAVWERFCWLWYCRSTSSFDTASENLCPKIFWLVCPMHLFARIARRDINNHSAMWQSGKFMEIPCSIQVFVVLCPMILMSIKIPSCKPQGFDVICVDGNQHPVRGLQMGVAVPLVSWHRWSSCWSVGRCTQVAKKHRTLSDRFSVKFIFFFGAGEIRLRLTYAAYLYFQLGTHSALFEVRGNEGCDAQKAASWWWCPALSPPSSHLNISLSCRFLSFVLRFCFSRSCRNKRLEFPNATRITRGSSSGILQTL